MYNTPSVSSTGQRERSRMQPKRYLHPLVSRSNLGLFPHMPPLSVMPKRVENLTKITCGL